MNTPPEKKIGGEQRPIEFLPVTKFWLEKRETRAKATWRGVLIGMAVMEAMWVITCYLLRLF